MNRSSSYFWKTSTLTLQWYECAVSCVHVHMYLCPHMFVPLLSCVARLANAVRSLLFGFDLGCLVVSVAQAFPGQSHAHGVRTTTASKAEGNVAPAAAFTRAGLTQRAGQTVRAAKTRLRSEGSSGGDPFGFTDESGSSSSSDGDCAVEDSDGETHGRAKNVNGPFAAEKGNEGGLFRRDAVVLLLDSDLQLLPFESMPLLRSHPVTRVVSIDHLHSLLSHQANNEVCVRVCVSTCVSVCLPLCVL